ncbi:hypothetical protein SDC9_111189 [bioreactor metagenome]|uniref:Uncharacterized protein n=1 Tax=bioreactor metagenome TaxID=1076179 RepID=A0A645BM04_9ZZZZ
MKHLRDAGTMNIDVKQSDTPVCVGKAEGQVGGDGAFAYAALAGHNYKFVPDCTQPEFFQAIFRSGA